MIFPFPYQHLLLYTYFVSTPLEAVVEELRRLKAEGVTRVTVGPPVPTTTGVAGFGAGLTQAAKATNEASSVERMARVIARSLARRYFASRTILF